MHEQIRRRSLPQRRQPLVLHADDDLVHEEQLDGRAFPLLLRPAVSGVDLVGWAAANKRRLLERLSETSALLFRGFDVPDVEAFHAFARAVCGDLMQYTYRSTPRTHVAGRIYTSTEYPAEHAIPLHNEMSYSPSWPMRIAFHSAVCAETGGETPIADSRAVYRRIDPAVRQGFAVRRVMYVRNYGPGLDLSWQDVFQTTSRPEVEAYCASAGIDFDWHGENRLRTRQVCQAVASHPRTGEMVWFNQAHLFHVSSLPDPLRSALLRGVGADDLPRNAYYGDGGEIEPEALDHIRHAYAQETVCFAWKPADILLLDNMLAAHGRKPFTGPRKVFVAMAEPCSASVEEVRS